MVWPVGSSRWLAGHRVPRTEIAVQPTKVLLALFIKESNKQKTFRARKEKHYLVSRYKSVLRHSLRKSEYSRGSAYLNLPFIMQRDMWPFIRIIVNDEAEIVCFHLVWTIAHTVSPSCHRSISPFRLWATIKQKTCYFPHYRTSHWLIRLLTLHRSGQKSRKYIYLWNFEKRSRVQWCREYVWSWF